MAATLGFLPLSPFFPLFFCADPSFSPFPPLPAKTKRKEEEEEEPFVRCSSVSRQRRRRRRPSQGIRFEPGSRAKKMKGIRSLGQKEEGFNSVFPQKREFLFAKKETILYRHCVHRLYDSFHEFLLLGRILHLKSKGTWGREINCGAGAGVPFLCFWPCPIPSLPPSAEPIHPWSTQTGIFLLDLVSVRKGDERSLVSSGQERERDIKTGCLFFTARESQSQRDKSGKKTRIFFAPGCIGRIFKIPPT